MSSYSTNTSFDEAGDRLRSAERVAVVTHAKPDGDAMGSALAVARACGSMQATVTVLVTGPVAPNLLAFVRDEDVRVVDCPPDEQFDLIVIVDTGAASQLDCLADWVKTQLKRTLVIDHHVNGDLEAALRIVEPSHASTTHLLLEMFRTIGVAVTGGPFGMAEALLLGLATDTGWFRYSNADAAAFRAVASLLDAGADKSRVHTLVEENDKPTRLALKARALGSLQLVGDNRISIMAVEPADFTETGGTVEDLVGIVNEPMSIATVRVSILMTVVEEGITKISFRSKPPFHASDGSVVPAVDVNRLASRFGGGGHVHAAGARIEQPLEEARLTLIEALADIFDACLVP